MITTQHMVHVIAFKQYGIIKIFNPPLLFLHFRSNHRENVADPTHSASYWPNSQRSLHWYSHNHPSIWPARPLGRQYSIAWSHDQLSLRLRPTSVATARSARSPPPDFSFRSRIQPGPLLRPEHLLNRAVQYQQYRNNVHSYAAPCHREH